MRNSSEYEPRSGGEALSIVCNADMQVTEIRQYCQLNGATESLVRAATGQMNLSARGYRQVLQLASANARSRTWQNASRSRHSGGTVCVAGYDQHNSHDIQEQGLVRHVQYPVPQESAN